MDGFQIFDIIAAYRSKRNPLLKPDNYYGNSHPRLSGFKHEQAGWVLAFTDGDHTVGGDMISLSMRLDQPLFLGYQSIFTNIIAPANHESTITIN